ncbi:MAG: transporter substrate-binding domain-containing protein [Pelomonas sp.]|nr:transporter substrate-binding domain-containing protein [Roseateles sp.]MBV8469035.1 transporter substrate-binding domain-containing protein [Burkholderiaceae bacterium]MBV8605082.1 transporter substrate-binding domain-containing protein [Roseateles sp.]
MVLPSDTAQFTRRALILALSSLAMPARSEPLTVNYPSNSFVHDPQLEYVTDLLRLALRYSGKNFQVKPQPVEMAQQRTFMEIARGETSLDLMWTMTNPQRETSAMIPVRIPVDRGLLGWRLLLIRQADADRWRHVASIADMQSLVLGQGHDWPDTEILRANGLRVGTSSDYNSLFRMLLRGRIDGFPRSILEIGAELKAHADDGLMVAPDLLLYYPAPSYFFVSPKRPELAEQIRQGLESSIADGSMQKLFKRYFGHLWAEFQLDERRVLRLKNPDLSPLTPLQRPELWLQPNESGARKGVS